MATSVKPAGATAHEQPRQTSSVSLWLLARGSNMGGWLRSRTLEHWAWLAVIALGALLRFVGMGDKPLHHDESMHAFYSYMYARSPAGYEYDPLLHGPFQFHAVGTVFAIILALQALFHVGGAAGSPWINDATARIVPTVLGAGTVVLVFWLRPWLGRLGALIAAFLIAVSPAFVYFSRFLREDVYFNFFMLAMVVCAGQFFLTRKTSWLAGAFAATALAYATFEGIFMTLLIFLSFGAALVLWELASRYAHLAGASFSPRQQLWLTRGLIFSGAGVVACLAAYFGLQRMHALSAWINANQSQADTNVLILEDRSVAILLWVSIVVALGVIGWLLWQTWYERPRDAQSAEKARDGALATTGRMPAWAHRLDATIRAPAEAKARLRERTDETRQPFIAALLSITWVQWFVAAVIGWLIFVALFWVIPGGAYAQTWGDGFRIGVGRGLWQGLYYWMTQQEVARGGQPWYYYLLLIPLYEQLAVVFGLAGAVYALVRPNRFRIFLVWWLFGSVVLYSWAGEKMPWLTIQILLPLMLLAGLALSALAQVVAPVIADWRTGSARNPRTGREQARFYGAAVSLIFAGLLLIPMVHNMWVLSRPDAAAAPYEMMVYVQTTRDVTDVMNKINAADKAMYGGQHQLKVAVGPQEEWPFYWYLRDYYLDPHPSTYAFIPMDVSNAQTA
ncbi:MAG TPA: flippase activity-associated protein Agl23, partial [Ktedonobacterales bacterium]